ncbi:unnamed protein product [Fusarium venenatum]|uniref:pH-response transcription factor pacC/RIM101 n=2 Tax=Fusarium venenatum TaxID=56646 RepID=A0A2L2TPJ7_9HYPO|nr:uncharacterized protein FVRRES_04263 [Fusarium venenatum]CEI67751.1 unnamed protein product [Fusarium venenatum]
MESDALCCHHCGERFQRREHRDRHLLRHTGHKPFQCDACSKSFGRHDTLVRHRALHNSRSEQSRGRRRCGRACVPCSRLKQGCSGGHPCSRCKNRDTECIYNLVRSSEIPSGDSDQDGTLSSPLTVRDAGSVNGDISSHDLHAMPNQLGDPTSNISDATHISNVYIPDTTISGWPPVQSLTNGNFGELCLIPGVSWTPWNPLTVSSSFPWFMDGLDNSLGFPDLPDLMDPIVVANASLPIPLTSTKSAPAVPVAATIGDHTYPQMYLNPEHICSGYTRPCLSLPKLQDISIQMARTEVFGHVHTISYQAVENLNNFYKTQSREEVTEAVPEDILHAFVELYFEFFDSQFPFLHPSRLEDPDLPWVLLLATAAVGSHYSEIQGAEEYNFALSDLLARAVEQEVSNHIIKADIATVQSVFLLHVLWMFSESHRDKVVLQHKRTRLSTLCWDLLTRANKQRQRSQPDLSTDEAWKSWLNRESDIRLSMCVRVLECLGHIFLFMPLDINLREATRQLPCDESIWKCRTAVDWKSQLDTGGNEQLSTRGQGWSQNRLGRSSAGDPFPSKVALIEFYLDERDISRQILTSKLLRSSFVPFLGLESGTDAQYASNRLDTRSNNHLLDTIIDQLTLANARTEGDTLVHFIAILRLIPIPLETLHFATGWQANQEQMLESKKRLRCFFQNNGSEARKGLWHAACIFKKTRNSRRLMCYDALSLASAMGYIYSYSEARSSIPDASSHFHSSSRPSIVRLDQLHERSHVEQWIKSDADSVVHLTGVGLLDGSDDRIRFLLDIEKTLSSQIAWRGFCFLFATCFSQLRRGEIPSSKDHSTG